MEDPLELPERGAGHCKTIDFPAGKMTLQFFISDSRIYLLSVGKKQQEGWEDKTTCKGLSSRSTMPMDKVEAHRLHGVHQSNRLVQQFESGMTS